MKCKNCERGKVLPASTQFVRVLCTDGERYGKDVTRVMSESGIRGIMPTVLRMCVDVMDVTDGVPQLVRMDHESCIHSALRTYRKLKL